ncbi:MAG: hypothetical protein A2017_14430 [Lentisphaerae bacterium GWF2_44_16]|nr:MAG: hypothetical protein A2017_14430 [Lentisphaerae bacterium GWF2_44_16]
MFSSIRSFISKKWKQREMGRKGLIGSRRRLKSNETFSSLAERSRLLGIFILAVVWCVCVLVLVIPNPKIISISLVPLQRSPVSIFADFQFEYEDVEQTKEKRDAAKASIPLFYKTNPESIKEASVISKDLFDEIQKRAILEKGGQAYIPKDDSKISKFIGSFDKNHISELVQLAQSPEQQRNYMGQLTDVLEAGIISQKEKDSQPYGRKIRIIDTKDRIIKEVFILANTPTPSESAEKVAEETIKYFSPGSKEALRKALVKITSFIIGEKGNLVYNEAITAENRKAAEASAPPVMLVIKKGQPVITRDQIVEKEDIRRLKLYEEDLKSRTASVNFWRQLLRSSLISLFMMVITGIYLYHVHPEVIKSNQKIWLIAFAAILCILINYSVVKFFNVFSSDFDIPPIIVMKLVPIALLSVLISALIGLRAAVYGGLFVSIITAIMLDNSFNLLMDGLFISCISGFFVRHSSNYRSFFIRALMSVTLTLIIMDISFFWEVRETPKIIYWTAGISVLNGFLTAVLALILLFIFESLFQVSTNMTLLTLCDYNHPLLKRLQLEAPGTYHHSIMVSTLAEQAAQEIGANPIKARVCALFHDIGKLSKPEYFTENNIAGESKHKELHPRMSSLIILNHVKEGVDMALKNKLRKVIREAIEQHHGTDLVYYFFKRAVDENPDKNIPIEEQEYRYPGPLPREKEVVLVSLADACEAASRTLQKPTPNKIDALVWEIFRKRIRDGQLDDAELTFGELAKVRESFVKTLSTMLHGRIAYPKDENNEEDEDDLFMAAKKVSATEQEST